MNYNLPYLPFRSQKPREEGLTIMTDRGLSVRETENFAEGNAPYTDFVKIAFGTSLLIPSLESKLNIYSESGITPYFGGTLFEAFVVRGLLDDYRRYLDRYGIEYIEISDGTIPMKREQKLEYIRQLSNDYTVISQSNPSKPMMEMTHEKWIEFIKEEISAGSWKVILKENEDIQIFNRDGVWNRHFIGQMRESINMDQLIWDAPDKEHQLRLINLFGNNVSLCNIASDDVISLEAKRLGLHSSTLMALLPEIPDHNNEVE